MTSRPHHMTSPIHKIFLLILVLLGISLASKAQVRLSAEVSPSLIANRLETASDTISLDSNGSGVRFRAGLMVDIPLTEYYFVQTGLAFNPIRLGMTLREQGISEVYNLQYVEAPLMLRLLTSELSIDTRLYFAVGGIARVLVSDRTNAESPAVTKFRPYDAAIHIGAGIDRKLGYQTTIYAGISYNRGLINALSETIATDEPLIVKSDILRLDVGLRF